VNASAASMSRAPSSQIDFNFNIDLEELGQLPDVG